MDDDGDADDESPAASTRALLAKPATPSRLPVARSLADAVPGEIVVVDRRGQSMTTRQVNASKAAYLAILVAGPAAIGVTYGSLLSPTVGVLAALAIQLLALSKMRHWSALRTAIAHAASYRWEDAHAALIALEGKRLPALQRQT